MVETFFEKKIEEPIMSFSELEQKLRTIPEISRYLDHLALEKERRLQVTRFEIEKFKRESGEEFEWFVTPFISTRTDLGRVTSTADVYTSKPMSDLGGLLNEETGDLVTLSYINLEIMPPDMQKWFVKKFSSFQSDVRLLKQEELQAEDIIDHADIRKFVPSELREQIVKRNLAIYRTFCKEALGTFPSLKFKLIGSLGEYPEKHNFNSDIDITLMCKNPSIEMNDYIGGYLVHKFAEDYGVSIESMLVDENSLIAKIDTRG